MPELPEVETTRRGIAPHVTERTVRSVVVREPRLRWRVPHDFAQSLTGQRVAAVRRRAKYLLLDTATGTVIVHLGMSGSLRVLPAAHPTVDHDHLDIVFDNGTCLRFNDPRRFGCVLWTKEDPLTHRLLKSLAPEPLEKNFDTEYLVRHGRGRKVAVKQFLMNSRVVVGVGNIYASEALFRAGVRPTRHAGKVSRNEWQKIARAIKTVLRASIRSGGTTLRDYVNPEGNPGYFKQRLFVYERAGEPCRRCGTKIKHLVQGQRSSYYCPGCQK
jgi:formamidopyrimidine-DNA glycosylase